MSVTFADGFAAAGIRAGLSSNPNKKDLALIVNQGPLDVAAGVFTANRFCAAPVQWTRKVIADGHAKAVVINSGCANACTGKEGYRQSQATAQQMAGCLNAGQEEVCVCSTGIIGELLPLDALLHGCREAFGRLCASESAAMDAAQAIMTTDRKPKTVTVQGTGYRIGGMVKGSGMIAPQLATMICIITTDALVSPQQLQRDLSEGVDHSFNRIDVDGCMSTNDTVLALASGASGVKPDPVEFCNLMARVCRSLSSQIVGDGEGSSHSIAIRVLGARDEKASLTCARAIASSNLLKCAIAGDDANWGRVMSSLGTVPQALAPFDPDRVNVDINGIRVCTGGSPTPQQARIDMTARLVTIDVNLGAGTAEATVWTDDLTVDYVHINEAYEGSTGNVAKEGNHE